MRRFLYSAVSALPSKLFSGFLGIGGIVSGLWPENVKSWVAWLMTPDQIRFWGMIAIGVSIAYWLILLVLKPPNLPAGSSYDIDLGKVKEVTVQENRSNSGRSFLKVAEADKVVVRRNNLGKDFWRCRKP